MSSCGIRMNIEPGVRHMVRKPMKTQIQVWREFGGGRKRGGWRPPGEIISWNSVDCSAGRGVWKTDKNTLTWGWWLVSAFYILSLVQVWSVRVIMETVKFYCTPCYWTLFKQEGSPPSTDLRYGQEDSISAITLRGWKRINSQSSPQADRTDIFPLPHISRLH